MISIDYETHKVQPGLLTPPIVCGGVQVDSPDKPYFLPKRMCVPELRAWLISGETIAGMNIAYDFGCAAAEDPSLLPLIFDKYDRKQVHDVGIWMMEHLIALGCVQDGWLLDPRTGAILVDPVSGKQTNRVSLAVCTDLCLGRKDAKVNARFRTSYALLENIPHEQWPPDAVQYVLDDVSNGLEVALWQLANCHNQKDAPDQCDTAWCLHLSSIWGQRTNAGRVGTLERDLLKKRADDIAFGLKKGLYREEKKKGVVVYVKNTKALKERVVAAYQGKHPTTPTNDVSCSRETLENSGDEVLERFSEVSNTEKRLQTYLPVLKQAAVAPLNPRYNVMLANGRVSVDGITQTMERKGPVRACFESRPGYRLSSVDWSAVEMSTLAQVCLWLLGESKLAEALREGKDPHTLFAAEMCGKSYEEVAAAVKAKEQWAVDLRQATKTADFGFNGMMGIETFVQQKRKEGLLLCQLLKTAERCGEEMVIAGPKELPTCAACLKAAKPLKNFYLYKMWTEMPKYFEKVTLLLEMNDDEMTQFVSERVRGGCRGPQAANGFFSGLAADMAKWVLRKMTRECYLEHLKSPLYGSRIWTFMHDETIIEYPAGNSKAPERQAEIHREAGKYYCPDVPVKAEPAIMLQWFKDAATLRDANGELILWAPPA